MPEMVERVARAIAKVAYESDQVIARAAIEAMRDPTGGMLAEGWYYAHEEDAHGTWHAMIDAALADDHEKAL